MYIYFNTQTPGTQINLEIGSYLNEILIDEKKHTPAPMGKMLQPAIQE